MELNRENYLELVNSKKYTRPQMAGIFGIPDWKLKRWIASEGLGRKMPKVRNKRAFQDKSCPNANYWAGFIAADGCVDKKGRIRFYLQLSDREHLEKFARFVGSDHKINLNEERNRCSIEFVCRPMAEDLEYWGIYPNKSLTYEPPAQYSNRHFVRGLFDGDGTICESFSNKNSVTATLYAGLACSYPCRDWFTWYCNNALGISLKQYEKENMVTITMNTNKSKIFLEEIYRDTDKEFRLDRKYKLYQDIVVDGIRKTR